MFGLASRSNDVIFFPIKIFNTRELAGQRQMLCEIREIPFEGVGIDVRDIRCPEDVGNALILFVQFWHSTTSHHRGSPHTWMIPLACEDDKQRWGMPCKCGEQVNQIYIPRLGKSSPSPWE